MSSKVVLDSSALRGVLNGEAGAEQRRQHVENKEDCALRTATNQGIFNLQDRTR